MLRRISRTLQATHAWDTKVCAATGFGCDARNPSRMHLNSVTRRLCKVACSCLELVDRLDSPRRLFVCFASNRHSRPRDLYTVVLMLLEAVEIAYPGLGPIFEAVVRGRLHESGRLAVSQSLQLLELFSPCALRASNAHPGVVGRAEHDDLKAYDALLALQACACGWFFI